MQLEKMLFKMPSASVQSVSLSWTDLKSRALKPQHHPSPTHTDPTINNSAAANNWRNWIEHRGRQTSRAHRLHFASALARQHRSPSTFPCASSCPPSLLFVLQRSLSVSSSYNSKIPKPNGMSASLPTCDRTKHTKQQCFKSVSQPSHSLPLSLFLSLGAFPLMLSLTAGSS